MNAVRTLRRPRELLPCHQVRTRRRRWPWARKRVPQMLDLRLPAPGTARNGCLLVVYVRPQPGLGPGRERTCAALAAFPQASWGEYGERGRASGGFPVYLPGGLGDAPTGRSGGQRFSGPPLVTGGVVGTVCTRGSLPGRVSSGPTPPGSHRACLWRGLSLN